MKRIFYIEPYTNFSRAYLRDSNFSNFIAQNSNLTIYQARKAWLLAKAFIAQKLIEFGSVKIPGIGLFRILISFEGKFKMSGEYKPSIDLYGHITRKLLDKFDFTPYIIQNTKGSVPVLYDNSELI